MRFDLLQSPGSSTAGFCGFWRASTFRHTNLIMTDRERLEGLKNELCPSCKSHLTTLVRLADKGGYTTRATKICRNPNCCLFLNLQKISGWKSIAGNYNFARDFTRQISPNYQPLKRRY